MMVPSSPLTLVTGTRRGGQVALLLLARAGIRTGKGFQKDDEIRS